jgi:hypothetical protein
MSTKVVVTQVIHTSLSLGYKLRISMTTSIICGQQWLTEFRETLELICILGYDKNTILYRKDMDQIAR